MYSIFQVPALALPLSSLPLASASSLSRISLRPTWFGVQGLGFRNQASEFGVQESGFRV